MIFDVPRNVMTVFVLFCGSLVSLSSTHVRLTFVKMFVEVAFG